MIFVERGGQRGLVRADDPRITAEEFLAVQLGPAVDEGPDLVEDQITAKGIIVEHGSFRQRRRDMGKGGPRRALAVAPFERQQQSQRGQRTNDKCEGEPDNQTAQTGLTRRIVQRPRQRFGKN